MPLDLHRDIGGGARIRAGIEFNGAGQRTAYWMMRDRLGEPLTSLRLEPLRLPATDCLHLFKPLAAGQLRGITWLAPVLLRLHELDQFEEAQYARTRLTGGEIPLCVVGSIGKLGVAPAHWAGANIARAVARISAVDLIDRNYLLLFLMSDRAQRYFDEATRTLAQPTLNVGLIEKLPIPSHPSPNSTASWRRWTPW